ncbi:hypothetical protein MPNT_190017 [Candidatus Methylacidithermus pantelleriae]|uniref:Uncharacterized protein n=1 Tax=Candidatus Methylacidithermus pantelleriae TaxID=2744239 RepID=A0A8J2BNZ5_9BACT|nr:hypothetical protein MPNT_190017 [Candidatus Methylacidithermus pantelleriae]
MLHTYAGLYERLERSFFGHMRARVSLKRLKRFFLSSCCGSVLPPESPLPSGPRAH